MSKSLAELCAELKPLAEQFETPEARPISGNQLRAATDRIDRVLAMLDDAAAAADIELEVMSPRDGVHRLQVSTADAVSWTGLLAGIERHIASVRTGTADPWQYQFAWVGLGQFAAKVRAVAAHQYSSERTDTDLETISLPMNLEVLTAAAHLQVHFNTILSESVDELTSAIATGSGIFQAYDLIDEWQEFVAILWITFDELGRPDPHRKRHAIARERRQLTDRLRSFERQYRASEASKPQPIEPPELYDQIISLLKTVAKQTNDRRA
jgi:hypothetical protein